MTVDPGVQVPEIPYTPFVTFTEHCVVDVGNVGDVERHAPVTFAPLASFTVPVIVIGARVGVGVGSGVGLIDGGSVRRGVDVGVTVRAGVGDPAADG